MLSHHWLLSSAFFASTLLVGQYLTRRKNVRKETPPQRIQVHAMRILFICDHLGYSEGGWNGCMTYFRNVLPQLQQEGHTVALCVLRGEHQAQDVLRALGIPVTSLDAVRASPFTLLYLMRKILREDLEIIHSAQRESSWHARVLGFLLRRPSVVHIVDSQPVPLAQRIIDSAMPQPDVALSVSRAIRSFASDAYGIAAERVCVLYNALDVERVKPLSPMRVTACGAHGTSRQTHPLWCQRRVSRPKSGSTS